MVLSWCCRGYRIYHSYTDRAWRNSRHIYRYKLRDETRGSIGVFIFRYSNFLDWIYIQNKDIIEMQPTKKVTIMPHISLAAEKLTSFSGFPITNSLLTTWLVMGLLFLLAYLSTHSLSLVPSGIQSMAEIVIGGLYEFFESVIGHHVKLVFPLLASLFLFIILANWVGLLPGVGTVGFFRSGTKNEAHVEESKTNVSVSEVEEKKEFVPLLRGATADLNTTLALAVFSVIAMQFYGFHVLGPHYGGRFLDFRSPIYFLSEYLKSSLILQRSYRLRFVCSEIFLPVKCCSQLWHFSCRLSSHCHFLCLNYL